MHDGVRSRTRALSSIISAAPQRRFAGLVLDGVDVNAAIAAATDARELEQAAQIAQRSRERIWASGGSFLSMRVFSIGAASAWPSAAGAAYILGKAPVKKQGAASGGPSSAFWLGGDFKENVAAGYLGGVDAVNGSLDVPGWLVRGRLPELVSTSPCHQPRTATVTSSAAMARSATRYSATASSPKASSAWITNSTISILLLPATRRCGIASGRSSWGAWRRRAPGNLPIQGQFETGNSDFWVPGEPA